MSLTEELLAWNHEQRCREAVKSLDKNRFTAVYCPTRAEAIEYILREAEDSLTIGFGGSRTLADLGLAEQLRDSGKELYDHNQPGLSPDEKLKAMRNELSCDLFLCSTNALTLTGILVNIDGVGNRVAAMTFGPKKVVVVAGRNKLVANTDEALKRIKNHVAPPNAKRLNYSTPCAKTGFCIDCSSPERICNVINIMEKKTLRSDIRVLVVNEDLGF
ncbi:MAG: lactate utilization protein [Firmicutes bacterium]|nr:lactate utilization protein [Bacillota bacterium]